METRLTIDEDNAGNIVVRPLKGEAVFENEVPFLVSDRGEKLALTVFDAAVWITIEQCPTIHSIHESLVSRYPFLLDVTTLSTDILATLKRFYRSRCIELVGEKGPLEILSWNDNAITQCHFALTYRCNLECRHCLISVRPLPELATDEVLHIIDQLWNLGCETISFSGGEVCLRKDFLAIANYVHKKGIEFGFNTNATLLVSETIDVLQECHPAHIGVSLYGDVEEMHDSITRARGSFARTMMVIHNLIDRELPVTIKAVLMKENYTHLDRLKSLASSLGCHISIDPHILPRQDGSTEPLNHLLPRKSLEWYYGTIEGALPPTRRTLWDSPTAYLCTAGFDRCAVDPYGNIFPCAVFPLRLGDVRREPLETILSRWRSDAERRMPRVSDLPECFRCEHNGHCSPCPGVSLIEEGDAKMKSSWVCMSTIARMTGA